MMWTMPRNRFPVDRQVSQSLGTLELFVRCEPELRYSSVLRMELPGATIGSCGGYWVAYREDGGTLSVVAIPKPQ